jgi:glycerol-3-phosphate O-acyltransferase
VFVPTTINYGLVLEAETLIEDWLKEAGKARYIIEDDEFSQIDRWLAFFRRVSHMESACVIRFGAPLDCFGNEVDDDAGSISPDGRSIDPGSYVMFRGVPTVDAKRDAEYTREMGQLLVQKYERETVLMGTQIVAHVLFRRLVRTTPGVDLFGRLRHRGEVTFRRDELEREVGAARDALAALAQRDAVHLSELATRATPDVLIDRVFAAWSGYHRRTAIIEHDGQVVAEDPTLLLYYQNRLLPYAERIAGPADAAAAQQIARMGS